MKWLIGIRNANPNDDALKEILEAYGFNIIEGEFDPNPTLFYLYCNEFLTLNESQHIWSYMTSFLKNLEQACITANQDHYNIELGSVLEKKRNTYRKHAFGSVNLSARSSITMSGSVATLEPILSPEGLKCIREETRLEEQKKKASTVYELLSIQKGNWNAEKIIELMNSELEPYQLGHVYDLILDEMNGDIDQLASKKECTRFSRSINHPEVYDVKARHIVSNQMPPRNPMTLSESKQFIRTLYDRWLKHKKKDRDK